jgi:uncharacterized protein (TIGR03067 family)
MRRHAVIVAVVSLVAGVSLSGAADEAKEKAVKKELKALEGTWKLVSREVDGKKDSEESVKDVTATWNEAGTITVRGGEKVITRVTTTLDPTKKPKTTDGTFTEGEDKGKTVLGIYELEGDTFRVCLARAGDKRPTEFSAKAGSGHTLMVYKREKK